MIMFYFTAYSVESLALEYCTCTHLCVIYRTARLQCLIRYQGSSHRALWSR